MNYIVQEMQTTNGVTSLVPPNVYSTRNEADAKFHTILAAAAVSNVEEHSAIMYTQDGGLVRAETYVHGELPESV